MCLCTLIFLSNTQMECDLYFPKLWRIFTFNILGVQPLTFSWEQAAPYVTQNWAFKLVTFANWTYWNCTAKQILYLSQILKEIALFCFNVRITSGPFLIFSSCFSSYFRCERSVVCFSFRPVSLILIIIIIIIIIGYSAFPLWEQQYLFIALSIG